MNVTFDPKAAMQAPQSNKPKPGTTEITVTTTTTTEINVEDSSDPTVSFRLLINDVKMIKMAVPTADAERLVEIAKQKKTADEQAAKMVSEAKGKKHETAIVRVYAQYVGESAGAQMAFVARLASTDKETATAVAQALADGSAEIESANKEIDKEKLSVEERALLEQAMAAFGESVMALRAESDKLGLDLQFHDDTSAKPANGKSSYGSQAMNAWLDRAYALLGLSRDNIARNERESDDKAKADAAFWNKIEKKKAEAKRDEVISLKKKLDGLMIAIKAARSNSARETLIADANKTIGAMKGISSSGALDAQTKNDLDFAIGQYEKKLDHLVKKEVSTTA